MVQLQQVLVYFGVPKKSIGSKKKTELILMYKENGKGLETKEVQKMDRVG